MHPDPDTHYKKSSNKNNDLCVPVVLGDSGHLVAHLPGWLGTSLLVNWAALGGGNLHGINIYFYSSEVSLISPDYRQFCTWESWHHCHSCRHRVSGSWGQPRTRRSEEAKTEMLIMLWTMKSEMNTVYRMVWSLTPSVRVFILVGGFIATRCLPCIAHFYINKLGGALCQAPKIIAVSDFHFFHSLGPVL